LVRRSNSVRTPLRVLSDFMHEGRSLPVSRGTVRLCIEENAGLIKEANTRTGKSVRFGRAYVEFFKLFGEMFAWRYGTASHDAPYTKLRSRKYQVMFFKSAGSYAPHTPSPLRSSVWRCGGGLRPVAASAERSATRACACSRNPGGCGGNFPPLSLGLFVAL